MIKMWAYDVEILPNFFSVTFVDLADYLKIFKDIHIIQKYLFDKNIICLYHLVLNNKI